MATDREASGLSASINLTLEPWTEEELREATWARCPECGLEVELATLVVEADGVWRWAS